MSRTDKRAPRSGVQRNRLLAAQCLLLAMTACSASPSANAAADGSIGARRDGAARSDGQVHDASRRDAAELDATANRDGAKSLDSATKLDAARRLETGTTDAATPPWCSGLAECCPSTNDPAACEAFLADASAEACKLYVADNYVEDVCLPVCNPPPAIEAGGCPQAIPLTCFDAGLHATDANTPLGDADCERLCPKFPYPTGSCLVSPVPCTNAVAIKGCAAPDGSAGFLQCQYGSCSSL
jgi:hypothetical protein